jgi:DNA-binding NarL/FixJ family response regulator
LGLRRGKMKKRLLLVDDEQNLLNAVAACLRLEGYEVVTSRSATEALARMAEVIPDLIVSDIRMPGMDGYTFARHLRSSPRSDLIPIVFLTAKDETSDRVEGFKSGVDAYITKPFEPEELIAVIDSILKRVHRTHGEIAKLLNKPQYSTDLFHDEELTEAEQRIAHAVANGLSNKEIANNFNISVRTVENHISHILSKKGFSNRVEITRYILQKSNLIE